MNLIHIGLPKSASTSLQDGLFARQERYVYFGKINNSYVSPGVRELLGRVSYQDSLDYDEHATVALMRSLRKGAEDRRPILVSDEQLSVDGDADRRLVAERLQRLFAPAKVLIILRSQTAICQSMYLHFLRSSGERMIPFGEWMKLYYGDHQFPGHRIGLDFARLVGLYEELFGRGNVIVLPFELIRSDSPLVPDTLGRLLGIESAVVAAQLRQTSENTRQSMRHQFAVRVQGMLPAGTNMALLGRKLLPLAVYERIRDVVKAGRRVPAPDMPEAWRTRVTELCASGNAHLEVTRGLPLKALGYPVEPVGLNKP